MQERKIMKTASDREAGILFGKASGWRPNDIYAPTTLHQLAELVVSAAGREWADIPVIILTDGLCVFIGNFWPYTWNKKT